MTIRGVELTLEEAATRLGKSIRQIRYAIQQGQLRGRKKAGRWFLDERDLPRTAGQTEVATARRGRHARRVDEALAVPEAREGAGYSVENLRAYQAAQLIFVELRASLGTEHAAVMRLEEALEWLTVGCHRFGRAEKAQAYQVARDATSRAVAALLVTEDVKARSSAREIERAVMPALSGLLRRHEGRRR